MHNRRAPPTPVEKWAALLRLMEEAGDGFAERVREEAGHFLEAVPESAPMLEKIDEAAAWLDGAVPGVRVLREIGRGGMGVVYEGVEETTDRHVAVKLLRIDGVTPNLIRRLKREAHALGRLEHPGIARLYTAGVCGPAGSPLAGSPYLVMELVHGEDPLQFAASKSLSLHERAELLCKIADAVGAAHEQRVLHLDLKPGNVLVREDGTIKVLDFSIARVLDDSSNKHTITLMTHPFGTVSAMSPEQIDGRMGSPSSDVYALGVLLHRLLTGRHPIEVEGVAISEAARRILEEEPIPPRRIDRRIPRDLETIVQTAMAREASDRYPDAGALSADLGRFLKGEVIVARRPGVWRRARAFVSRRRTLVAATGAVALALLLGIAGATAQAVRAMRAEAQAQERFQDVRALANAVIYEIHDAIEDLPGSTVARRALVDRALVYLDALSQDTGADAELRLELAEAYLKVSQVQGDMRGANLGDMNGARNSVDSAIELLKNLPDDMYVDRRVRLALSRATLSRAILRPRTLSLEGAYRRAIREDYDAAMALVEGVLAEDASEIQARKLHAQLTMRLGLNAFRDRAEARSLDLLRQSVELHEALRIESEDEFSASLDTAWAVHYLGYIMKLCGEVGSVDTLAEARGRFRELAGERPWSTTARFGLGLASALYGLDLARRGDFDQAIIAAQEGVAIFESLFESDPHSQRWHRDVVSTQFWLGQIHDLRAASADVTVAERQESAIAAVKCHRRALEWMIDREGRGWLPEWESHYPEMTREHLKAAEERLRALELEAG